MFLSLGSAEIKLSNFDSEDDNRIFPPLLTQPIPFGNQVMHSVPQGWDN